MNKLPLISKDILSERIARIREEFPEVFSEGKIDFERLKMELGVYGDTGRERYGLSWAGKSDAIRNIQTASVGTLLPVPDKSLNFETSENLIIEGDNLEVLKLLQKSYHGKIKMIYIDPPYNTGNEFIYPDNFREGLDDYLRYSGQVDSDGVKLSTNTETDGRFHSKWLNMMYPRLFLARNLLKEDGCVFVSIDDNEVKNLRALLDEIFGEENFVANVVWQKRTSPDSRATIGAAHDYILVYARSIEHFKRSVRLLPLSEDRRKEYKNPDNDPRGLWVSVDLTGQTGHATPSQFYTVHTPAGVSYGPPEGRCWAVSESTFRSLEQDGRIWFGKEGDARPRLKRFLTEAEGMAAWTWWTNQEVGHNQEATKELNDLLGESDVFNNPKPVRLIRRMLQLATTPNTNDIVLDFFGGSGTTGHAVIEENRSDDGNRKFILVQLPEPVIHEKYHTIADITRERIQRVCGMDVAQQDCPFGFKAFKLSSSNFAIWQPPTSYDVNELARQLALFTHNILPGRNQVDILYEIVLKFGLSLNAPINKIDVAGQAVFSIASNALLICLEEHILDIALRGMVDLEPRNIVCLDAAFHGNDNLKTNTKLLMESHGIEFHTV